VGFVEALRRRTWRGGLVHGEEREDPGRSLHGKWGLEVPCIHLGAPSFSSRLPACLQLVGLLPPKRAQKPGGGAEKLPALHAENQLILPLLQTALQVLLPKSVLTLAKLLGMTLPAGVVGLQGCVPEIIHGLVLLIHRLGNAVGFVEALRRRTWRGGLVHGEEREDPGWSLHGQGRIEASRPHVRLLAWRRRPSLGLGQLLLQLRHLLLQLLPLGLLLHNQLL